MPGRRSQSRGRQPQPAHEAQSEQDVQPESAQDSTASSSRSSAAPAAGGGARVKSEWEQVADDLKQAHDDLRKMQEANQRGIDNRLGRFDNTLKEVVAAQAVSAQQAAVMQQGLETILRLMSGGHNPASAPSPAPSQGSEESVPMSAPLSTEEARALLLSAPRTRMRAQVVFLLLATPSRSIVYEFMRGSPKIFSLPIVSLQGAADPTVERLAALVTQSGYDPMWDQAGPALSEYVYYAGHFDHTDPEGIIIRTHFWAINALMIDLAVRTDHVLLPLDHLDQFLGPGEQFTEHVIAKAPLAMDYFTPRDPVGVPRVVSSGRTRLSFEWASQVPPKPSTASKSLLQAPSDKAFIIVNDPSTSKFFYSRASAAKKRALPDGVLDRGVTPEEAAAEVLYESTGLKAPSEALFHVASKDGLEIFCVSYANCKGKPTTHFWLSLNEVDTARAECPSSFLDGATREPLRYEMEVAAKMLGKREPEGRIAIFSSTEAVETLDANYNYTPDEVAAALHVIRLELTPTFQKRSSHEQAASGFRGIDLSTLPQQIYFLKRKLGLDIVQVLRWTKALDTHLSTIRSNAPISTFIEQETLQYIETTTGRVQGSLAKEEDKEVLKAAVQAARPDREGLVKLIDLLIEKHTVRPVPGLSPPAALNKMMSHLLLGLIEIVQTLDMAQQAQRGNVWQPIPGVRRPSSTAPECLIEKILKLIRPHNDVIAERIMTGAKALSCLRDKFNTDLALVGVYVVWQLRQIMDPLRRHTIEAETRFGAHGESVGERLRSMELRDLEDRASTVEEAYALFHDVEQTGYERFCQLCEDAEVFAAFAGVPRRTSPWGMLGNGCMHDLYFGYGACKAAQRNCNREHDSAALKALGDRIQAQLNLSPDKRREAAQKFVDDAVAAQLAAARAAGARDARAGGGARDARTGGDARIDLQPPRTPYSIIAPRPQQSQSQALRSASAGEGKKGGDSSHDESAEAAEGDNGDS